jgi:glycosyltransferase involved in cell wall biosynthesis
MFDAETRAPARTGLLFVHTPTKPPLGADTWVHAKIIEHLDRSHHNVHAACAPGTRGAPSPTMRCLSQIPDLDVRAVHLGTEIAGTGFSGKLKALAELPRVLASLVGLARFIRREGVEIIHTSDRPRDAFACVVLARLTRTTCVVHAHVGYGDWMSPILKWSLKRADALIAVSQFVADTLISSGHCPSRIRVVLNAIEPSEWSPGEGREDARAELGLPEQAPVIVTVCRLFPSKGAGELIRCVPSLRGEFPEVRLVVVGGEMTLGFRSELEQLAHSLGVADNVKFTGLRDDVARMMAAADVFAMPSLGEPFGLVYIEAMAMKLPVVALDSGGAPEVVEHGVTGLLAAPGDRDALLAHLLELLRDPKLRHSMGERGRQTVELRFRCERMATDTASVYEWMDVRRSRVGAGR